MSLGALIIRVDASVTMGTGHAMRCLALAQAWQDAGGRAIFAMAESTLAVDERLRAEGFPVVRLQTSSSNDDAEAVNRLGHENQAAWLVVDGYQFDGAYQAKLKQAGRKLLVIDDNGNAGRYCADLVVNQNLHAREAMYANCEPYSSLYLGPRYALLRREFASWRSWKREVPSHARKVMVTMGGSDPDNVTLLVIQALRKAGMAQLEGAIVIGGSNPQAESLQRTAREIGPSVQVLRDVARMGELMAWADIAISAAGTSCWELCLLGLPSLLIDLADNQTQIAREMHTRGCGFHLGSAKDLAVDTVVGRVRWLLAAADIRRNMSQSARKCVDGYGAQRVVAIMSGHVLQLRDAGPGDCRLLWEWANDPEVRASAFTTSPISWDEHVRWFDSRMHDPHCQIFIGQDQENRAIGQFRVECATDKEPCISVSLSREFRGAGYGSQLIDLGVQRAAANCHIDHFHAFVRAENRPSRRAFEKAKFRMLGEEQMNGCRAIHYVRNELATQR